MVLGDIEDDELLFFCIHEGTDVEVDIDDDTFCFPEIAVVPFSETLLRTHGGTGFSLSVIIIYSY